MGVNVRGLSRTETAIPPEIRELLHKHGAKIKHNEAFSLVEQGRKEELEWMLDEGVNPDLEIVALRRKRTLLMIACWFGFGCAQTSAGTARLTLQKHCWSVVQTSMP